MLLQAQAIVQIASSMPHTSAVFLDRTGLCLPHTTAVFLVRTVLCLPHASAVFLVRTGLCLPHASAVFLVRTNVRECFLLKEDIKCSRRHQGVIFLRV